jgi:hypothetical protein
VFDCCDIKNPHWAQSHEDLPFLTSTSALTKAKSFQLVDVHEDEWHREALLPGLLQKGRFMSFCLFVCPVQCNS